MSFGNLRDLDPLRFPEAPDRRRRRITVAADIADRERAAAPTAGPFVASMNDLVL